jgi:predicted XRE-type DNA-binding protein
VFCVARFEEAVYVLHLLREENSGNAESRNRPGQTALRSSAGDSEIEMGEAAMKATSKTTITKGSGDVFADLGFSPSEAHNLRLRSQMMTALRKSIEKQGLTQAEAAKRLKVTQPRISDLTCGKISRFSLDTLVNMLADDGLEVDLRIKQPARKVA